MKSCFKCGKSIEDYELVCNECAEEHEDEEAREEISAREFAEDQEEM